MAALTDAQIGRIRADIGDTGTPPTFSDAVVQDVYDQTDGAGEKVRQRATRGLLIRRLLAQADKFADYTAGATSEKRSQIRTHLMSTYQAFYASAVDACEVDGPSEVARVGLRHIPRAGRTYPWGWDDHD